MIETQQLTRAEAEDFLYREARLLDDRRLDDWLGLFTEDAHYWIPTGKGIDPNGETQLVYDDRAQLEDRVWQAQQPRRHAQSPPSATTHLISNVLVESATDGELSVYSSFVVYEVRKTQSVHDEQRSFAGRCEHRLRRVDGQWCIVLKKIWLINRDLPVFNLTFLV